MSTFYKSGSILKWIAKLLWFRPGSTRTCLSGPYAGTRLEISGQMRNRMSVFISCYEPEVTQLLKQHVRPGMVIYDIGAHVGVHTLYMCRLLEGSGAVFAFEPWPANMGELVRNLQHNPPFGDLAVAVPLAVGDNTGLTKLMQGASDGRHSLGEGRGLGRFTVGVTTLDDFIAQGNPAPNLVKIDIEGHEPAALAGATNLLQEFRPHLVLEHHGNVRSIVERLARDGYATEALGARHLFAYPQTGTPQERSETVSARTGVQT